MSICHKATPHCVVHRLNAVGSGCASCPSNVRLADETLCAQIAFLVNEGALVTACTDDTLNMWNIRQKIPEVVHTLKFQRER